MPQTKFQQLPPLLNQAAGITDRKAQYGSAVKDTTVICSPEKHVRGKSKLDQTTNIRISKPV